MVGRRWLVPLAAMGVATLLYRRVRHQSGGSEQATTNAWEFAGPMPWLYDRVFAPAIAGFYARVAARVTAGTSTGQVLDVGCGPGHLPLEIARQAPGLSVTGIDIVPGMIDQARRRAEIEGLTERVRFEVADVGALPFPDEQFDLVVSTMSLHHWRDPVRGLGEIRRVLKPGGRAYIYDVADWIFRWTHGGTRQATILASSPLAREAVAPAWSVGPVPVVTSFSLRR